MSEPAPLVVLYCPRCAAAIYTAPGNRSPGHTKVFCFGCAHTAFLATWLPIPPAHPITPRHLQARHQ